MSTGVGSGCGRVPGRRDRGAAGRRARRPDPGAGRNAAWRWSV